MTKRRRVRRRRSFRRRDSQARGRAAWQRLEQSIDPIETIDLLNEQAPGRLCHGRPLTEPGGDLP